MNLKIPFYDSFYPIVESVQDNFDTVVYDCGITLDRGEIFNKMPFFGINPPSNACLLSYITLPTDYDKMLITKSFFSFNKSITSINEVKRFLENQFEDAVYIIPSFRYTLSGKLISNDIDKIEMMYCTLINFSY